MTVELEYNARVPITRPLFSIGLSDGRGSNLLLASMLVDGRAPEMVFGVGSMRCHFPTLPLLPRTYRVWCSVRSELGTGDIVPWEARGTFSVGTVDPSFVDVAPGASVAHLRSDAPVYAPYTWEHAPEGPRGPSSDTTDRLGAAR
jgi:hypothetical protein